MRLLFVCNEYPPSQHGGIGTFVQTLGRELVKQGHTIYVVGYERSVNKETHEDDQGIHVIRIPQKRALTLKFHLFRFSLSAFTSRIRLSRQVNKLVKQHQIDLVESYDWSGPLWFSTVCPLLVRLHGAYTAHAIYEHNRPGYLMRLLEQRNVSIADHLVAVSHHIRESTLKALGMPAHPCDVIYNGVDVSFFAPVPNIHPDANVVLFVGKIHPRKGIRELLEAWEIVHKRMPSAKLRLVGSMPKSVSLETYLIGLDIDPASIEFVDFVPHKELPAIYCSAAVVVMPSKAEAFGLTCAEAMACQSAVVMTSLASGSELIEDKISGLLANPLHPQEFADAIIWLLQNQPLRVQYGRAARERVLRLFNKTELVRSNLALYEAVINQAKYRWIAQ